MMKFLNVSLKFLDVARKYNEEESKHLLNYFVWGTGVIFGLLLDIMFSYLKLGLLGKIIFVLFLIPWVLLTFQHYKKKVGIFKPNKKSANDSQVHVIAPDTGASR